MPLNVYVYDTSLVRDEYLTTLAESSPQNLKVKLAHYSRFKDRKRVILSHFLVRSVLANELSTKPNCIEILVDKLGKPFLDKNKRHFNYSYSKDLIVIATDDTSVGVDVEYVQPLDDLEQLVDCFSSEEKESFFMYNKEDRLKYFYTLWTLKESYLKAIGEGLHRPLNSFSIDFQKGKIAVRDKERAEKRNFKGYDLLDDYKCAVCATHGHFPDKLIIHKVDEFM